MSTRSQRGKTARTGRAPEKIVLSDLLTDKVLAKFRDCVRLTDWGCLEWTGPRTERGYGRMAIKGRSIGAYRVAWMLANHAEVPEGLAIDHKCCNPACVNADHLEAVTPAENSRRVHRPPEGWQTIPQPHCEVLERVDGQRRYVVEWVDSTKHIEFFDDPDDAKHFMRFLTVHKGEPRNVVPRDIHERLDKAFTDEGLLWLNEPHRDLDGKKPIDLLKTGHIQRVREITVWMDEIRDLRAAR